MTSDPGAPRPEDSVTSQAGSARLGVAAGGAAIVFALGFAVFGGLEGDRPPAPAAKSAETGQAARPEAPSINAAPVEPLQDVPDEAPAPPVPAPPQAATPPREQVARPSAATSPRPAATLQTECPEGGAPLAMIVAFGPEHSLGRAHALFSQGRRSQAEALVLRALAQDRDLRGLCLVRFGVGGAEVMLAPSPSTPAPTPDVWTARAERLAGVAGVTYAYPDMILQPGPPPPP